MDAIENLLSQQLVKLSTLERMLDEEKDLLTHRDTDKLMAFVMKKKDVLDAIAEIDTTIKAHPEAETVKSGAFQESVDKMKALLASCQKKSAVNEQIVSQSLGSLERLGKVLTEVRSTNLTYDAAAKKVSLSGASLRNIKA